MWRKSPLFIDFSEEEIEEMLIESESFTFYVEEGEYIFTQGDIPEYMYILVKGGVQVEKVDSSGKRSIVNIFREGGTVFGEVYLYLRENPYDYSCVAVLNSEIIAIPKKFFLSNRETNYQRRIRNNMLTVLSEKAFYLNQKLLVIGGSTIRQKIANYLIQMGDDSKKIKLKYNREELADFIGVTRPALSRELKNMETDGLIKLGKDFIEIKDEDKVYEIL